jgi:hypothetical protein
MAMPGSRSDVYRWAGTFAAVYVLALTILMAFFVWWTHEPAFPPSVGKESCAPYRDSNPSTDSCLA